MTTTDRGWVWPQPYELLDHTADTGVRVRGATAQETLARLVLAHAQLVAGGVVPQGDRVLEVTLPLTDDLALAAVDVLREVNRLFAAERAIVREVEAVELSPTHVALRLRCGDYEPSRHPDATEIKAVTYHQTRFSREGTGYVAEIVFDI
jgi:SHS2 domain-containing protein